ncbi:MAG TPA: NHL repeat-containing protein [Candidatus Limnocylindrales bacterium]|nr:NHL repeat-containing protein [Candidatus Limnocylindrales bacterium]
MKIRKFGADHSDNSPRRRLFVPAVVLCALVAVASCSSAQHAAQSAPPPPLQYLGEWGAAGTEPGQFQNPQSFGTDGNGNVYIADDGKPARIEEFSSLGQPLLVFNVGGNQNNWDVAVDAGNAIFVLDMRMAQVQIFSPEGEMFRTLRFRYRPLLRHPTSIAIEPSGDFYLADFETGRIARMDPMGHVFQTWGKPKGLAVKRWTPYRVRLDADENLYVADAVNQRIEKISPDGQYIFSWDFPLSNPKLSRDSTKQYGLAVSGNFVAAADEAKRLLEIWTLDGAPKLTVDFSQHTEWGQNATPTDIAFTPKGTLLVLDGPDARVLRFRLNMPDAEPNSPSR